MKRKKAFKLNTYMGLLKQLMTLICGFVMTKAILSSYGSSVNGLVSSIIQFLGFISLLEMGVGPVIQSNLYKPLAEHDEKQISRIVKSSNGFFRNIAYIFIVYIIVLVFVYPKFINSDYSFFYTGSLIVIIAISNFTQYYFGITKQLLLNADQKGYVQLTIQWGTLLLETIVCVILMKYTNASIQCIKLITTAIYVFRPVILSVYVNKHYKIDKKITYKEEPIKQKWNGFAQHLCSVVADKTDIIVLTLFSTLTSVSIYHVYYNVAYGITQVIMSMANGIESLWGNMFAKHEMEELRQSFSFMEWAIHTLVTIVFSTTALLVTPFVLIYTKGITDVSYNQPIFGIILVSAFAVQCYRVPYFRLIKAAGHYKQTQTGAIVCMVINILVSVLCVQWFGLTGVAIGTFVAFFYHTLFFVLYIKNYILSRSIFFFIKQIAVNSVTIMLSYLLLYRFASNISSWKEMITKTGIICLFIGAISLGINLFLYKKYTVMVLLRIIKK